MFRKKSYNFTDKTTSKQGILAVAFGAVSFLMFVFGVYRSFRAGGNASILYGLGGVYAFLLAVVGFVIAVRSYFDENTRTAYKHAGSLCNLIMILIYAGVFFLGIR